VLGSYGLRTYIWNNRLKSLFLLAGFPFLLLLISFGFALVISAWSDPDVGEGIAYAFELVPSLLPVALIAALIWFVIAWFANQKIVDVVTGARKIDRASEPRLWNVLENLCISRGITMPRLRIIETPAMNAFASGVRKSQYTVTVTRGLLDTLNEAELAAVLAHELTHIENRDVQLLVVAAVFVGIISLVGDILIRGPRLLFSGGGSSSGSSGGGFSWGGGGRSSSSSKSSSKSSGGGGAIVLILIAIAIFLIARLLALALHMAMSRKREFLADAGSVELTKNPDAMISALRKIAGHSDLHAPAQIQEMFLDHPRAAGFAGWLSTHPSIDDRVSNLVRFAGGHDQGVAAAEAPASPAAAGTAPATPAAAPPHPAIPGFGRRDHPPAEPVEGIAKPWGEPPA
jgi:heat shock protein HtpX